MAQGTSRSASASERPELPCASTSSSQPSCLVPNARVAGHVQKVTMAWTKEPSGGSWLPQSWRVDRIHFFLTSGSQRLETMIVRALEGRVDAVDDSDCPEFSTSVFSSVQNFGATDGTQILTNTCASLRVCVSVCGGVSVRGERGRKREETERQRDSRISISYKEESDSPKKQQLIEKWPRAC